MGIEKALKIGERGAKALGKEAIELSKSGWGKAAIATVGTGLIFSDYIYPKYVETKKESNADEVQTDAGNKANDLRYKQGLNQIYRTEGNPSPLEVGKTPSGQYNLSGIAVLVVLVIIAFVVIKVVKK